MLRKKLQEMTEVEDVSQHPGLLNALSREWPNTVKIASSSAPIERYTCLMYVFDFAEKPEYIAIARYGFNHVYAGGDFAHWLIDRGLLQEVTEAHAGGDVLVLYFDAAGRFKHAGLVVSENRVLSKWGIGHLYAHGLLEVPESYGTKLGFFKKLPYQDVLAHFRQFARERGMLFS